MKINKMHNNTNLGTRYEPLAILVDSAAEDGLIAVAAELPDHVRRPWPARKANDLPTRSR